MLINVHQNIMVSGGTVEGEVSYVNKGHTEEPHKQQLCRYQ